MTVYESLNLMIEFSTLVAMILIGVFTYKSQEKKK